VPVGDLHWLPHSAALDRAKRFQAPSASHHVAGSLAAGPDHACRRGAVAAAIADPPFRLTFRSLSRFVDIHLIYLRRPRRPVRQLIQQLSPRFETRPGGEIADVIRT
jgi:hypothetical protein